MLLAVASILVGVAVWMAMLFGMMYGILYVCWIVARTLYFQTLALCQKVDQHFRLRRPLAENHRWQSFIHCLEPRNAWSWLMAQNVVQPEARTQQPETDRRSTGAGDTASGQPRRTNAGANRFRDSQKACAVPPHHFQYRTMQEVSSCWYYYAPRIFGEVMVGPVRFEALALEIFDRGYSEKLMVCCPMSTNRTWQYAGNVPALGLIISERKKVGVRINKIRSEELKQVIREVINILMGGALASLFCLAPLAIIVSLVLIVNSIVLGYDRFSCRRAEVLRNTREALCRFKGFQDDWLDWRGQVQASSVAFKVRGAKCGVCGTGFSDSYVQCRSCLTLHHLDCWEYCGKCSVFGCGETRYLKKVRPTS